MSYQAFDLKTNEPVGPNRASIQFARSDALRHQRDTGRDAIVARHEIVWTTQTIDSAIEEAQIIG